MTYAALVLDTETTQIEQPEVIELAFMGFFNFPTIDSGCTMEEHRFEPMQPSQYGALAVHGILDSELVGKPSAINALNYVPAADYWIGHNIDFDWKALEKPPVKRICTLALARHLLPDLDSHSLASCMYAIHGRTEATRQRLRNAHSALPDIRFCLELFDWAMKVQKITTLEEAWALSENARIPRKWTFGKFFGKPIGAADRGYASWYSKQSDTDPYVLLALRKAGLLG